MQTLLKIILLFLPVCCLAQNKVTKPEFANQGEQEDYWARQLFDSSYVKQEYPLFSGTITIKDGEYFSFNGQVLIVSSPAELVPVFSGGIFYPQLITGDCGTQQGSPGKKKEVPALFGCDSLRISDIEELTFMATSVAQKRFRFLLWRKGFANPRLQFLELTNDRAKENMTLTEFIKGARLTFYKAGSILI